MNRVTSMFASDAIRAERIDHPPDHDHEDVDVELSERVAVAFVERGEFALRQGNHRLTFSPGDALLTVPGLQRRYEHASVRPQDVCLSVVFAPDVVEDALGAPARRDALPRIAAGVHTRIALRWMSRAIESSDAVAIESAAFHCVLALSPGRWQGAQSRDNVLAHARRIRRACDLILSRYDDTLSLAHIAHSVGMSTFHFARCFSAVVGESPHCYVLRVRFFEAARLLRDGASVADAAARSGFGNVSHFSRSFQRRFGVAPSAYVERRASQAQADSTDVRPSVRVPVPRAPWSNRGSPAPLRCA